jgi:hypothetical protein
MLLTSLQPLSTPRTLEEEQERILDFHPSFPDQLCRASGGKQTDAML